MIFVGYFDLVQKYVDSVILWLWCIFSIGADKFDVDLYQGNLQTTQYGIDICIWWPGGVQNAEKFHIQLNRLPVSN